jgi:hypothetical protein
LPHPPSPTTTNFFENDGPCVTLEAAVVSDNRSVDAVMFVLAVPLLFRVLCCRMGFRRGDTDTDTDDAFSLITDP